MLSDIANETVSIHLISGHNVPTVRPGGIPDKIQQSASELPQNMANIKTQRHKLRQIQKITITRSIKAIPSSFIYSNPNPNPIAKILSQLL